MDNDLKERVEKLEANMKDVKTRLRATQKWDWSKGEHHNHQTKPGWGLWRWMIHVEDSYAGFDKRISSLEGNEGPGTGNMPPPPPKPEGDG